MKIYLGVDHRGFKLKQEIKPWLTGLGHEIIDLGANSYDPDDDNVDFAAAAAHSVSAAIEHQSSTINHQSFGILICGSGVGMEIAANRVRGIRCGLGLSPAQVAAARNDDDINILSLAADYTDIDSAKNMIKAFLETAFSNAERHIRRIKKIEQLRYE